MRKKLETVEAVVRSLYGKAGHSEGRGADMARELGRSRTAVWKYLHRDQLPGDLYEAIQSRARVRGFVVADELFTPVSVHPNRVKKGVNQ
jgi:hypothetical protein